MTATNGKTLRLHMPQWQGGNLEEYHLSSKVLSWLLPASRGPEEIVPVPSPGDSPAPAIEDGILARKALLDQARAARAAIERHRPDRILTIGGDCLVDLAPIAYLNKHYRGTVGVLWIDAHPDVQTPKDFHQGNSQVLAMLLGEGDPDFLTEVDVPVDPTKVMYAGLDEWSPPENEFLVRMGLRRTGSAELAESSSSVLKWIEQEGIEYLAIHFDVDAIRPQSFRPMLFNKPGAGDGFLAGVPRGRLEPKHVLRLLGHVAGACDIVGLAITEYISWDAIQTRKLLAQLPLIGA
ncbi:arginase family protein [Mesorhizobium sp. M1A.F.Ca.IN.020.06.1.1]|uniref:arginase family protein n=1 Tax=unclassified Mesorhizobium TaxID=325217 RepID=UPI000BB08F80|nr:MULTISPECIES: arginase family protein [unclassified Mesorhizobium]PBB32960.1 arginase [Mesorhizobium sp. WSM3882]RUV85374.1 arginase family protein [Mesorhizobium sp. M1A.F.Ca.IN.020.32.1.1]RUW12180.1 arginase family protein [Mesorhizobium sp. M1A.F.Ca.IN.022.05.2.1]RUW25614.1 arginase family protein [Mesorhizobium sp. M1A.F.Ca.IN.020.06.1.1]RWF81393.1 MAG: arginase family protein [Mesorhizobium sp.]